MLDADLTELVSLRSQLEHVQIQLAIERRRREALELEICRLKAALYDRGTRKGDGK